MSIKQFNKAWKLLAKHGNCDGFGGMEYMRVLNEWHDTRPDEFGDMPNIPRFIIERANALPEGIITRGKSDVLPSDYGQIYDFLENAEQERHDFDGLAELIMDGWKYRTAVAESKDAIDFRDRVRASSVDDRIAVGTDAVDAITGIVERLAK